MKHNIILLTCLLAAYSSRAQFKDPSFSFGVVPTLGNRLITYRTSVSKAYKDSINKADRWRDAIGASCMFGFRTNMNNRIFVGLQFHNFGFTRKRENLRFMDTIHPGIGIMNDLSQTGPNYVAFNHRYMYVSIPFMVSTRISGKKMKSSTLDFVFGGSLSGLVKHDIRAQLHGFSAYGEKIFILDDKEAEAGLLNGNLHVGFRLENPVYGKHTFVYVQPTAFLPVLPANYSKQRNNLFALGVEVGVMYRPEKEKQP